MTGIDTNVLIRYITQDDPEQSPVATAFLEQECSKHNPGYVTHTVLCEITWVLGRAYNYDRTTVVSVVKQLLNSVELDIQLSDLAWAALRDYQIGSADFPDYLIARTCNHAGCTQVVTFDSKAAKHRLFRKL